MDGVLEPRGMSGSSNYRLSLGVRMKSHGWSVRTKGHMHNCQHVHMCIQTC